MNEVLDYLKECKYFFLATSEENGQPRVRPFGAVCAFEGKLYMSTHNEKKVYQQLIKNAKVEICGMSKGSWMRIEAEVALDIRREARVKMIEDNPTILSRNYHVDDGVMAVFYLKNATATIYSHAGEPKVINF